MYAFPALLFENDVDGQNIRQLMANILSAIPNPISLIDAHGVICLCNEAMQELFPEKAITGRPINEVLSGFQLMEPLRTSQTQKWQKTLLKNRFFLFHRSPVVVNGETVGALAVLHDASDPGRISDESDIIVRSPSMRAVFELALRLDSVEPTVLIQGESGVGKKVIAELIHRNSARRHRPFIKVNCAAIPGQLLESELFGAARGALTGANKEAKAGLFEAATGGTLLLDEVGALPLPLQGKLLHVIQESRNRHMENNISCGIDTRLLAATSQDLPELVSRKHFREDLHSRLNAVPIHVPPLRDRKEDILFMVRAFLKKFCERHKKDKELHPAVMPNLLDYSWPGNARELENIMERLVVTSPGPIITLEVLPDFLRAAGTPSGSPPALEGRTLRDILEDVEARVLKEALLRHKTTRGAAEALGINQSSVVRKARRLGINVRSGGK